MKLDALGLLKALLWTVGALPPGLEESVAARLPGATTLSRSFSRSASPAIARTG